MRREIASLFIAVFLILIVATPLLADTRRYIGDEPSENYAVGRQGDLKDAITTQLSIIPGVFPDDPELRDQLIWLRYPANNYHFKTAPSVDQNFFFNKMEDAATSVQDAVANLLFGITRSATLIANNLVLICFDNYIGQAMFSAIGEVVNTITKFEEGGLMSLLFLLVLCMLGIGIAGFLIRAQVMRALSSVLVAVICLACIVGYALFVDKIIPAVINFTNNATGVALMATTYIQDIPVGVDNNSTFKVNTIAGSTTLLEQGLIETTNATWHTLVGAPWAVGMFGNSDPNKLKLLPSEIKTINKDINKTFSVQLFGPDGIIDPEIDWDNLMPWKPKKELPENSYMDSVWLACSNDVKNSMLEAIANNQERYEGKAGEGGTAALFTLGQGTTSASLHGLIAFLSLFPSIIFLLFVVLVGIPVFIAQFVLMILLILLPFALLLGVSGERGTQITLLYLKSLLGAAATKIIYGFYMSFILLFTIALNKAAADNFALGAFLISVIFVFAIKFRKSFFEGVMGIFPATAGHDYADDAESWFKRTVSHFLTGYLAGKVADTNDATKIAASARRYSNPNPQLRRDNSSPADGRRQTAGQQRSPVTPTQANQEPGIYPPPGSDTSKWDYPEPTQSGGHQEKMTSGSLGHQSDNSLVKAGTTSTESFTVHQEPGIHPPPGSDTSWWDFQSHENNPAPTTASQQQDQDSAPNQTYKTRAGKPHNSFQGAYHGVPSIQRTKTLHIQPSSNDSQQSIELNSLGSIQNNFPSSSVASSDDSGEYIQAKNPEPPTRK